MITSLHQLDFNKHYTYADYILWQFKERVELLKGRLLPMAAPNVRHQEISSYLHVSIGIYLLKNKKGCKLFSAPFDVRLPLPKSKIKSNKIDTVVQPDLCVVCDEDKLDKQGCVGAPDLVIEILSPGNSKKEMKDKFELYQEAGVLEYWVIDPEHNWAFAYYLDAPTQKYVGAITPLTDDETLKSRVFEGLDIELIQVFPEERNV
ncbi:MAG: Uma2 family endonuclease [Chitinophagales bacterium]